MAENIFHEIEFLEKYIEDPKEFEACKHKLQEYSLSCPEDEKSKCEFFLSKLDEDISYYTNICPGKKEEGHKGKISVSVRRRGSDSKYCLDPVENIYRWNSDQLIRRKH